MSAMRCLLILMLCWLSNVALKAQTITFDIRLFNSSIGKMVITRHHETDGTEWYTLESNTQAKVLWITKTYHSSFEARYKNGVMISCSHKESESGNLKRWARVTLNGKAYQVESDHGTRTFTEAPVTTDLSMYFEDATKLKRIFYLPDAEFNNLKWTDSQTAEFKSSDGHRNVYNIQNGQIQSMEFHLALATVYMVRMK